MTMVVLTFSATSRPQWVALCLFMMHLPFNSSFLVRDSTFPFHVPQPLRLSASTSEALLETLQSNPQDEQRIASCISNLEAASGVKDLDADFDPLLGLYEVSYVKTQRPNDNPVGGKWTRKSGIAQKLLRTRRSFQHILPTNSTGLGGLLGEGRKVVAEAVNVISLEAFYGLLPIFVILRGDAIPLTFPERTNTTRVSQPLSILAVKALFDAPRIVVGTKGRILNINVGPKTSVLLDTLYCDDNLRLGMGGTSGSRFVFKRCLDDDQEANEFRALLHRSPTKKYKSILWLGSIATLGVCGVARGFLRLLSGAMAALAVSLAALIAFSGGGIEQGDMGVTMRKEGEASSSAEPVI
jgi:hypothetical protein